jgi:hypothetical protein
VQLREFFVFLSGATAGFPRSARARQAERARGLVAALAIGTSFVTCSAFAQSEINILTCALEHEESEFKGTCEVPCSVNALAIDIDGPNPTKACTSSPRRVQATLRETGASWLGTMQGKFPEDPTCFEVVMPSVTKPGIAKTPFGWFSLQSAQRKNELLSLTIVANNQLPPTQDDIRIIQRAAALLSGEEVWNREDNRTCPPNPQKWSLFCALQQATQEVSGGVHYRQPALQMAREVLDEVGGDRLGKHRLMDYNNHRDTTLAEVHSLLHVAQARLEKRLR